jgi:hypothetical protein
MGQDAIEPFGRPTIRCVDRHRTRSARHQRQHLVELAVNAGVDMVEARHVLEVGILPAIVRAYARLGPQEPAIAIDMTDEGASVGTAARAQASQVNALGDQR